MKTAGKMTAMVLVGVVAILLYIYVFPYLSGGKKTPPVAKKAKAVAAKKAAPVRKAAPPKQVAVRVQTSSPQQVEVKVETPCPQQVKVDVKVEEVKAEVAPKVETPPPAPKAEVPPTINNYNTYNYYPSERPSVATTVPPVTVPPAVEEEYLPRPYAGYSARDYWYWLRNSWIQPDWDWGYLPPPVAGWSASYYWSWLRNWMPRQRWWGDFHHRHHGFHDRDYRYYGGNFYPEHRREIRPPTVRTDPYSHRREIRPPTVRTDPYGMDRSGGRQFEGTRRGFRDFSGGPSKGDFRRDYSKGPSGSGHRGDRSGSQGKKGYAPKASPPSVKTH